MTTPRHSMKKRFAALAVALLATATAPSAQSITKVLFMGGLGGGAHNPTPLADTLAATFLANGMTMSYRSANVPVWLHPDTLAEYDVMLVYTTNQNAANMSQAQFDALKNWIEAGHVVVALHGSTNTWLNGSSTISAAWRGLMGGQFQDHASPNNSGIVTYTVAGHPALLGTSPLPASGNASGNPPFWDEGRRHNQFASDTVVIARAQLGSSNVPWIWVRPQGEGWVYYNASGHDAQVWKMAEYKAQIVQALKWGKAVAGPTALRGKAALDHILRAQAGNIIMPTAGAHSIYITDMQGRRVYFRNHSSAASHDVSALPAGTYGVRILSETAGAREAYNGRYVKEH